MGYTSAVEKIITKNVYVARGIISGRRPRKIIMKELNNTFNKLKEHLEIDLIWRQVEELYEQFEHAQFISAEQQPIDGTNQQPSENRKKPEKSSNNQIKDSTSVILQLPLVKKALANDEITSILLELCSTIRELRDDSKDSYNSSYDNWDKLAKVVLPEQYLSFVYILAGLPQLKVDSLPPGSYRLALIVVDAYLLTLTIPGATGYHIFEENIFIHCMQIFKIIDQLCNTDTLTVHLTVHQKTALWIQFCTLCDDLKLVLRYVHFKDHLKARDVILKKCIDVQYLNHEKGYTSIYAANFHQKTFEIFEEVINAHNGNTRDTLSKIMNMTAFLHSYTAKPKPLGFNLPSNVSNQCEHISDWFIKCVTKYPRIIIDVLNTYIECIITNPIRGWRAESLQRAMDYAAKYDAALFTKCNSSCQKYLCQALYSDEANIRCRAVELIGKILQLDSEVDWQMFRHEVSKVPREVHFIKELIESLQDCSDNVKLKAAQALLAILSKGSSNSRNIFVQCIKHTKYSDEDIHLPEEPKMKKNEMQFEKPRTNSDKQIDYNFSGHEIIESSLCKLPQYIFKYLYKNSISYVRRTGIILIEELIKLNLTLVFNTKFVSKSVEMINEPTATVRKQLLHSMDSILEAYPNCYPVLWAWCKVITPMMRDADAKNIELAMECFTCRVLRNMRAIDRSNKPEHFMPWVIIRILLSTESRYYLQKCFFRGLQSNMINKQIVGIIESYLLTSYSTEAWVVLNFVKSAKVKSVEPDALINHFISYNSWNKQQNMLIALEVLSSCIEEFSHSSLNHAFNYIVCNIKDGQMMPLIVGKAIDFLLLIDNRSQTTGGNGCSSSATELFSKTWLLELHEYLEQKIQEEMKNFPENHSTFLCYLYAYSEINMHTRCSPPKVIISFIQKFMNECIKLSEANLDLENERLLNSMILLSGRFALRDSLVAQSTCTLYANALKIIDRPPVVNTIMVALTDLCKKHTYIVEGILSEILNKLNSSYDINRIETFKCFEKLVLQDQLKLRGTLFLCLLTTVLDPSNILSNRAKLFFDEYAAKKNNFLFQKCLYECPFVLNEYHYFDGLENFSEANIKSPLKGETHQQNRQVLYEYILQKVDNINQIAYFGQLKLLTDKRQQERLISTDAGITVIKDILFILKKISYLLKDQLKPVGESEEIRSDSIAEDLETDLMDMLEDGTVEKTAGKKSAKSGKGDANKDPAKIGIGRGRKKRELTLTEATAILENSLTCIPILHENINKKHPEIEKSIDSLCRVLCRRYVHLLEYAQPRVFWQKYLCQKTNKSHQRRNKSSSQRHAQNQSSNDSKSAEREQQSSASENYSSDDGEGSLLISKKSRTVIEETDVAKNCDEMSMKYIFNINT